MLKSYASHFETVPDIFDGLKAVSLLFDFSADFSNMFIHQP